MTLEEFAKDYPEWRFWRSRNGRLICATRRTALTREQQRAGCSLTLIADHEREMSAFLKAEAEAVR